MADPGLPLTVHARVCIVCACARTCVRHRRSKLLIGPIHDLVWHPWLAEPHWGCAVRVQVHEYDEWGDPRTPGAARAIQRVCPYAALGVALEGAGGAGLPGVLVTCALDDARVPAWVPAKWAARARRLQVGAALARAAGCGRCTCLVCAAAAALDGPALLQHRAGPGRAPHRPPAAAGAAARAARGGPRGLVQRGGGRRGVRVRRCSAQREPRRRGLMQIRRCASAVGECEGVRSAAHASRHGGGQAERGLQRAAGAGRGCCCGGGGGAARPRARRPAAAAPWRRAARPARARGGRRPQWRALQQRQGVLRRARRPGGRRARDRPQAPGVLRGGAGQRALGAQGRGRPATGAGGARGHRGGAASGAARSVRHARCRAHAVLRWARTPLRPALCLPPLQHQEHQKRPRSSSQSRASRSRSRTPSAMTASSSSARSWRGWVGAAAAAHGVLPDAAGAVEQRPGGHSRGACPRAAAACPPVAHAVDDEGLRVTLKDERLQRLLTEVDSSGNREKVGNGGGWGWRRVAPRP